MEQFGLTTRTEFVGGEVVVWVAGDVDLASSSSLRDAIEDALTMGTAVVVDATELHFIDSSGLSALIWGHQRAQERGGSLVLRHPPAMLRRLLEITRLETVLAVAGSDDATQPHAAEHES